MKKLLLIAAAVLFAATAQAQVCDDDTDPNTAGDQNNCDCASTDPPDDADGCLAVGEVCVAGNAASLTGCVSLSSGNSLCATGGTPGAIPCADADCAAAASAGCGGA